MGQNTTKPALNPNEYQDWETYMDMRFCRGNTREMYQTCEAWKAMKEQKTTLRDACHPPCGTELAQKKEARTRLQPLMDKLNKLVERNGVWTPDQFEKKFNSDAPILTSNALFHQNAPAFATHVDFPILVFPHDAQQYEASTQILIQFINAWRLKWVQQWETHPSRQPRPNGVVEFGWVQTYWNPLYEVQRDTENQVARFSHAGIIYSCVWNIGTNAFSIRDYACHLLFQPPFGSSVNKRFPIEATGPTSFQDISARWSSYVTPFGFSSLHPSRRTQGSSGFKDAVLNQWGFLFLDLFHFASETDVKETNWIQKIEEYRTLSNEIENSKCDTCPALNTLYSKESDWIADRLNHFRRYFYVQPRLQYIQRHLDACNQAPVRIPNSSSSSSLPNRSGSNGPLPWSYASPYPWIVASPPSTLVNALFDLAVHQKSCVAVFIEFDEKEYKRRRAVEIQPAQKLYNEWTKALNLQNRMEMDTTPTQDQLHKQLEEQFYKNINARTHAEWIVPVKIKLYHPHRASSAASSSQPISEHNVQMNLVPSPPSSEYMFSTTATGPCSQTFTEWLQLPKQSIEVWIGTAMRWIRFAWPPVEESVSSPRIEMVRSRASNPSPFPEEHFTHMGWNETDRLLGWPIHARELRTSEKNFFDISPYRGQTTEEDWYRELRT